MKEVWKDVDVKGYEGLYQISNYGKLKRYNKILKPTIDGTGYVRYTLSKKCEKQYISSHRLVALHFIKKIKNKKHVNHKNGIKTDNFYKNLEWCTQAENVRHMYETGLRNEKGENNSGSKLTEKQVIEIINMKKNLKYKHGDWKKLAKKLNVTPETITNIIKKKRWRHLQ